MTALGYLADIQAATYLERHKDVDLELLAFTLNEKRSQLDWRAAVCAGTSSELGEILNNDEAQIAKSTECPKVGFVFTGQGAQWPTMGVGLLAYPVFAQTLHNADSILKDIGAQWSLLGELRLHAPTTAY